MTGLPALRVLSLDLSLAATGIAWSHDPRGEASIGCRTIHTARSAASETDMDHQRLHKVWTALVSAARMRPHLVVVEWLPQYGNKGDTSLRLAELHGLCKHWLWSQGLSYTNVLPTHLKQYATGRGNATKDDVLQAAIERYGKWCHIGDHNSADALTLLAMGLDAYAQPLVQVGNDHRKALRTAAWPDIRLDDDGPGR